MIDILKMYDYYVAVWIFVRSYMSNYQGSKEQGNNAPLPFNKSKFKDYVDSAYCLILDMVIPIIFDSDYDYKKIFKEKSSIYTLRINFFKALDICWDLFCERRINIDNYPMFDEGSIINKVALLIDNTIDWKEKGFFNKESSDKENPLKICKDVITGANARLLLEKHKCFMDYYKDEEGNPLLSFEMLSFLTGINKDAIYKGYQRRDSQQKYKSLKAKKKGKSYLVRPEDAKEWLRDCKYDFEILKFLDVDEGKNILLADIKERQDLYKFLNSCYRGCISFLNEKEKLEKLKEINDNLRKIGFDVVAEEEALEINFQDYDNSIFDNIMSNPEKMEEFTKIFKIDLESYKTIYKSIILYEKIEKYKLKYKEYESKYEEYEYKIQNLKKQRMKPIGKMPEISN